MMPRGKLVVMAAVCWLASAAGAARAQQYPLVVETPPLSPAEQRERFRLPPGFQIELVASEPDIAKPMNLNFDHRGRLFVTQSIEYPFAAQGVGRDAVRMLQDADGDGRYETATTAVDQLNIPIGITPLADDLLVYSIPNIWRYPSEGDARWGDPQVLFGPFGYEDTHGMNNALTRWIDGWIYACHGFRNTSTVAGSDGQQITMQSGNTYRFQPDGSHIELYTHGQVNPFGLCFDPLGNSYTADCHSQPIYQLLRGGYYPSFGKPHDGLGFAPTLVQHSHGSTGIGGIVYYAADQFPEAYRDTIFVGNPITHRINHDRLEPSGATYQGGEQPDFLICDDPWFRPVDLQLGPDGALYIADFYNCIIGHYEVPLDHPRRDRHRGRIWRVVYQGEGEERGQPGAIEDLSLLSVADLWQRLASNNLTVRVLATHLLVDRDGQQAAEHIQKWIHDDQASATQRAHGLWVLERVGALNSATIERLADDADPLVRVHLIKALGQRTAWPEEQALDVAALVRDALNDEDAFVRRAAADALGLHPDVRNIAPLLELGESTPGADTHLVHVVRMALRDQLRAPGMYDQLPGDLVQQPSRRLRLMSASLGIAQPDAARFNLQSLNIISKGRHGAWLALVHHVARYLPAEELTALEDYVINEPTKSWQAETGLYQTLGQAFQERSMPLPPRLRRRAARVASRSLRAADAAQVQAAVKLAEQLRLHEVYGPLAAIALQSDRDTATRQAAIQACVVVDPQQASRTLSSVLTDISQPTAVRGQAARALASIDDHQVRQVLMEQLSVVHFRLASDIAAALASTQQGAELLLAAIEQGKASPRLLRDTPVHQALLATNLPGLADTLDQLTRHLPAAEEQLAELTSQRRSGYSDAALHVEAGRKLYHQHCGACHRLSGEGSKIGPDLDGIGSRGLDRLLEDVLDPNRNVDPNFKTTIVETSSGQIFSGLALEQEGSVLVLIDSKGQQQRIEEDEIEQRRVSPLSPMPANVSTLMSEAEFYHLIGYLLSQRAKQ